MAGPSHRAFISSTNWGFTESLPNPTPAPTPNCAPSLPPSFPPNSQPNSQPDSPPTLPPSYPPTPYPGFPSDHPGRHQIESRFNKPKFSCEPPDKYCPGGFHPVEIGATFFGRYKVVEKLGFGRSSTVWLATDAQYVECQG